MEEKERKITTDVIGDNLDIKRESPEKDETRLHLLQWYLRMVLECVGNCEER
jgi:hypothetical protein